MTDTIFFDRDISWLSFNERVLQQAAKTTVPLMERIRFLSIYSSNLDEFYRVRVPALALQNAENKKDGPYVYQQVAAVVSQQQQAFGQILRNQILPALNDAGCNFIYNQTIPAFLKESIEQYFFNQVAGLLHLVYLTGNPHFFPENNQLYMAVDLQAADGREEFVIINIPYNVVPRFFSVQKKGRQYIVFLEDIIQSNLQYVFPGAIINGAYNIKITRDAELNLGGEYSQDLEEQMEEQLAKRDMGFASRLLYEPGIPLRHLHGVVTFFNLQKAAVVEGGKYHNLKDLSALPVNLPGISYDAWPTLQSVHLETTLFNRITEKDVIVHAPYQSYDAVLRFFNEAALDPSVEEIYTTLYRVASRSRIAQALISASQNGKKVTVLVELKARFDEANNINWAKKMKANGVKIVYSNNAIKVHAKIALIKRKHNTSTYLGLLATGNLNETTARFYTDHILLTAHTAMLTEIAWLFEFLAKKQKPLPEDMIPFQHLLVAQFNLQSRFLELIDREIVFAKNGQPASVIIKMNNLEEGVLIKKLYEASNAGVNIRLIVRGICRLVAGLEALSENISIKRIVDRYLEHGRIFIFNNNGYEEIFLGSADWMNRNIYRRIEVCFPIYDEAIKSELRHIVAQQLADNLQAVWVDANQSNKPVETNGEPIQSQKAIYKYLQEKV